MSETLNIGDVVMLIGCDDNMPPIGSVGEIVGIDTTAGIFDFEVYFPDHLCPVEDPNWLIPPPWLMKIKPPHVSQIAKLATLEAK